MPGAPEGREGDRANPCRSMVFAINREMGFFLSREISDIYNKSRDFVLAVWAHTRTQLGHM